MWPLENGDWAWNAWTAASLGLPRSGIATTEVAAERAAQQEIERMLSEARAAAQTRRELPVRDDRGRSASHIPDDGLGAGLSASGTSRALEELR